MRRSYGAITNSDDDPPPYSLPHIGEMSSNDDWTVVKDPSMKKRIQNRVAQRTYRQRMKERVADLQEKLKICERRLRSREIDCQDGGGGTPESPIQTRDSLRSSSQVESPAEAPSTPVDCTLSSSGGTSTTNSVEQEILEASSSFLSEQRDGNNGRENDGEHILSPPAMGYVQDTEAPRPGYCGTDSQHTFSKLLNGQADSSALGDGNDLTSYLSTEFSPWMSSTLNSPMQELLWTGDARPGNRRDGQPGISMSHDGAAATPISWDQAPRLASDSAGMDMDERVGCALTYLRTVGFKNIDELVCTYYGQQFQEASFLYNEQRLSRNRRLPGVVASVFCAATKWSAWESRGFHEEILKATEAMLISESEEAWSELQAEAARVLETPRGTLPNVAPVVSPLKKSVTDKVSRPE
ncbi:hypothetical protein DL771_002503 [Monosporascus sp. 5C6A]|nr:hypothetical protein DL771_002503 [Monosporascus sp. 5C6A]